MSYVMGFRAFGVYRPRHGISKPSLERVTPDVQVRLRAVEPQASSAHAPQPLDTLPESHHPDTIAANPRNAVHRRNAILVSALSAYFVCTGRANALPGFQKDLTPVRKRRNIDPELYTDGEEGLKYYDVKVGEGQEARAGDRVVIHYEAKWKGITFLTSRVGAGVTGGNPYGFDVGNKGFGFALKGVDLGVRGMRVGGLRKLILPPNLAYGEKGIDEIPGNATLDVEIELLSIKTSPLGYQVKLVEG